MGFVAVEDAFGKRNPSIKEALDKLSEEIKAVYYDEKADDIDDHKMTREIMKDPSMNRKQKE